jgi:hypothetical protein
VRYLNEKLDYVASLPTREEQVAALRDIINKDQTFIPLMRMAFVPGEGIEGLAEGFSVAYKPDTSMPDGFADTQVQQEMRRIKKFLRNGEFQKLGQGQRELLWLQLVEGLHFKEAAILNFIKDRKLGLAYPNLPSLLSEFGVFGIEGNTRI